jgi:oxygen-dependent protoporphyrinogen oxidase
MGSALGSALVIGGGLSGLTAALRLAEAAPAVQITVVERLERVGGQIWTEHSGDVLVERGGEGFVFRSEAVPAIASAAGVGEQLMGQAVFTSYGFGDRGLIALAPGEAAAYLGFQVPREDLGRGIRTLRSGMGALAEGLARKIVERGVMLRTEVEIASIGLDAASGTLGARCSDGAVLDADCIAVATTAASAARLIDALVPDEQAAVQALAAATVHSSVTVEIELERSAINHPLDGTGVVVATAHQQHGLRACTFTTSKFEGRAPSDRALLRAFFRPEPADESLSDQAWAERAHAALARLLPITSPPLRSWVTRWPYALPVHTPAHAAIVAQLESALQPRNVCLAGAAFHGSGIDAAVRSGEAAARFLAAALATKQAR